MQSVDTGSAGNDSMISTGSDSGSGSGSGSGTGWEEGAAGGGRERVDRGAVVPERGNDAVVVNRKIYGKRGFAWSGIGCLSVRNYSPQ